MAILFGSDSAEDDELLLECEVDQSVKQDSLPVVTGRWGTGKSASLILGMKYLSDALSEEDSNLDRVWLIDESGMSPATLVAQYSQSSDKKLFAIQLKQLWKGEILRRLALILATLRDKHYKSLTGDHWQYIISTRKSTTFLYSLWSQIPTIVRILSIDNQTRFTSIDALKGDIEEVFSEQVTRAIKACLFDIQKLPKAVYPIVAIEPIDTPTSALEDEASLANEVIESLLNVFLEDFKPSQRQPIQVRIGIPWHRITNDRLVFPHKLPSYTTRLTWRSDELRIFINRRIMWEFRRIGRSFTEKGNRDAWSLLFADVVRNQHCIPTCFENSFSYVLRHTHHRPRDIQQIVRLAVTIAASETRCSIDEVLHCRGGVKITSKYLTLAVQQFAREGADYLLVEAGRKIPGLRNLASQLRSISVPFTLETLEQRLAKDTGNTGISEAVEYLWDAGIIGVQKTLVKQRGRVPVFPDDNQATFTNKNNTVFRPYYFFYYNSDDNVHALLDTSDPSVQTDIVLHPRTFEIFFPRIPTIHPIGI